MTIYEQIRVCKATLSVLYKRYYLSSQESNSAYREASEAILTRKKLLISVQISKIQLQIITMSCSILLSLPFLFFPILREGNSALAITLSLLIGLCIGCFLFANRLNEILMVRKLMRISELDEVCTQKMSVVDSLDHKEIDQEFMDKMAEFTLLKKKLDELLKKNFNEGNIHLLAVPSDEQEDLELFLQWTDMSTFNHAIKMMDNDDTIDKVYLTKMLQLKTNMN